ncbi:Putative 4,5-dihydroxyphthalate dehydrogenase (plasmid) [Roseivivax sp. THAF40]|uniref:Gfo/Idh/MocA family protein n=1 Tax=unclassified Roseivivax TaxID=2639302 RepID=UPI00126842C8|nr:MULTISPECIES: Gfo/Idh/MocA family oxidoreductase [unclassified Roseivivax]QFS84850.1 Putative 4,5-dihydroxyphthalate dehydrogenase [Roseivivax sp. THAF197b]QFT48752.1 Putative 4,5-dihydroxyphthalate dehydrogenase [Roseivivax sp. THAF40]
MINYGIIGAGMMGQEHIRNIQLLGDARVDTIFEPDLEQRGRAGAIAPDAVMVDSVADLLARQSVDVLLIASPNHHHVRQMEEIAAIRPLPLLVEKPLFTRHDDAERIAHLAKDYPAPIWVAMEYRYMPPIAMMLERLEAATGGLRMLTIREHRFPFLDKVGAWNRFNASSGGTLVEKCCHFFDLMRLASGAEPVRVMASGGQGVNHLAEVYDGHTPDIWDNAYVIVDFDSGMRAMLELCMFAEGSRYQEHLSAVGPTGKIEALVPGPTRFWPERLGAPPVPQVVLSPRDASGEQVLDVPVDPTLLDAGDHNGSTFYQHQKFLRAVQSGGPVEVSLADGAKAVAMGLAAQKSAETGEAVRL